MTAVLEVRSDKGTQTLETKNSLIATGSEALGAASGWSPTLYKLWYVSGAIGVAAYLGAGTLFLHRDPPFGSLTVVWGRSGSGKTTLLRVLTGLDRPVAGTVEVAGTDLAGLDRTRLAALRRRYLAVCPQQPVLAETLDVVANLELARQARGLPHSPELVEQWLDLLGLAPLRHRPTRVLSGG